MNRLKIFLYTCLLLTSISFVGCKVGDDDPAISFRSRNKRLLGKWNFKYFFSDTFSIDFFIEIKDDGTVVRKNTEDSTFFWANWRWLQKNESMKKKEFITMVNIHKIAEIYKIEKLSYEEIILSYSINNTPGKSFKATLTRIK